MTRLLSFSGNVALANLVRQVVDQDPAQPRGLLDVGLSAPLCERLVGLQQGNLDDSRYVDLGGETRGQLQPGKEAKVLTVGFQCLSRRINVPAHRALPEELGGKSRPRVRGAR
jgi:hypothetical protein